MITKTKKRSAIGPLNSRQAWGPHSWGSFGRGSLNFGLFSGCYFNRGSLYLVSVNWGSLARASLGKGSLNRGSSSWGSLNLVSVNWGLLIRGSLSRSSLN